MGGGGGAPMFDRRGGPSGYPAPGPAGGRGDMGGPGPMRGPDPYATRDPYGGMNNGSYASDPGYSQAAYSTGAGSAAYSTGYFHMAGHTASTKNPVTNSSS